MRLTLSLAIGAVAALSTSLAAQASGPDGSSPQDRPATPPAPSLSLRTPAPPRNPFGRLFRLTTLPLEPTPRLADQSAAPAKPKVVCGMLVVPVDRSVDPQMRIEQPPPDITFTIRTIHPKDCMPRQ